MNLTAILTEVDGEVTWSGPEGVSFSNNKGIETTATIGSGVTAGNITITAKVGEHSANYTIKVVNQVTSITVGKKEIEKNEKIGINNIIITKNQENTEELTNIRFEVVGSGSDTTNTSIANIVNEKIVGIGLGTTKVKVKAEGELSGTEVTGIMEIEVVKTYETNIGDYYNYSVTVNGQLINDWKVFWKDSEGIYIITSDYLPVAALGTGANSIKEKVGLTTTGTYKVYWNSVPTSQIDKLTSEEENKLLNGYHKYTLNASNANSKYVSTLLNTENWNEFVDSAQRAKYAIGGPTLEMYISSWNEKTKNDANRAVISCQGSGTGYQIKIDSKTGIVTNNGDTTYDNYLNYTNMNKTDEYNVIAKSGNKKSLYYPYTASVSGCEGYWLASPSANRASYVCLVYYSSYVGHSDNNAISLGIRPVVYIQ